MFILSFLFRFDWFFGEEELIGAELNKMNGVIISGVNPFTRCGHIQLKNYIAIVILTYYILNLYLTFPVILMHLI